MRVLFLLSLMLVLGGDRVAEGERAYREGRFRDALEHFTAATRKAGDDATAALLHNQALAALGAGELAVAEIAAEKAAARGGAEFFSLRDFLLGNAAFARCAQAEVQALRPEAEPFAFDIAISYAEGARRFWELAAASRSDWPAARRNVERALIKLEELGIRKEEAEKRRKKGGEDAPKPPPPPERQVPPGEELPGARVEERRPAAQTTELSPEQLRGLLEKLGEKEEEKLRLRRARREVEGAGVEREW